MATQIKADRIVNSSDQEFAFDFSDKYPPEDGDVLFWSQEEGVFKNAQPSVNHITVNGSGGDVETTFDGYNMHVFNQSGDFTIDQDVEVDVLVVAGGGCGGTNNAGGGGAGGLVFKENHSITKGTHVITIGGGNSSSIRSSNAGTSGGKNNSSYRGQNSVAFGLTAIGGGNGGGDDYDGYQGGSGGGAADNPSRYGGSPMQPSQSGDSGTFGFGNRGGSTGGFNDSGGCGGGGAGTSGGDGAAAPGGQGKDMSAWFGTSVGDGGWFAGGGGGGYHIGISSGTRAGGQGGGGTGGNPPTAGQQNTGGGGGGKAEAGAGAAGGSGIVIVRYIPFIGIIPGATEGSAAASAEEILALNPDAEDGVYWIKTATGVCQTYCMMSWGGYMLAGKLEGWTGYGSNPSAGYTSTI